MALKPRLPILALFGAAALGAAHSSANFADSAGFSGKNGVTCVACHTQPWPQPAAVALDGLPQAWDAGAVYDFTVTVSGGPPAAPAPQAQGGFDVAASAGRFTGDTALLRFPSPDEATYLPAGTHQRAWHLQWHAPGLAKPPASIRFWLAALAANGNHVIATNASDGGETLDAAASLVVDLPPSGQTLAAWRALPLAPPAAVATSGPAQSSGGRGGWTVAGQQRDANATAIGVRLDGGPWTPREAGPEWTFAVPAGTTALEVRSEGSGRESPAVAVTLPPVPPDAAPVQTGGAADAAHSASASGSSALAVLSILVAVLAAFTFRRTP